MTRDVTSRDLGTLRESFKTLARDLIWWTRLEISWVIGSLGLANVTGLIILFEEKYLEDNRDVADEIVDPYCATSLSRLY